MTLTLFNSRFAAALATLTIYPHHNRTISLGIAHVADTNCLHKFLMLSVFEHRHGNLYAALAYPVVIYV